MMPSAPRAVHNVVLTHQTDFDGFRAAARRLAAAGVEAADIVWRVTEDDAGLFLQTHRDDAEQTAARPPLRGAGPRVPRAFLDLAQTVICHRDPGRFALLYRLLLRLAVTPKLLEVATDRDVHAAQQMARAVRRDEHKMHAFVRFRELATAAGPAFLAWFEPDHSIEEHTAGFFVRRFAAMRWSIITPRRSLRWDGTALSVGPGGRRADVPAEDAQEALWLTYYSHIFNPARLKVKAMEAEMPRKYWKNLPEAKLIPGLIAGAEARTRSMIGAEATTPPLRAERLQARQGEAPGPPPGDTVDALRREAAGCTRCHLHAGGATQTVFGEGPADAALMMVGEQPGDREDLAGRPFVGPAGEVLDEALAKAGIDRAAVYLTNAVKHFKFEPRGRRRLHKTPNQGEVLACRWWLDRELAAVSPRLVVGLGGTAVSALFGKAVKIGEVRGRVHQAGNGPPVFATVHPSFILRLPDPDLRQAERLCFIDDLKHVADWMAQAA